MQISEDAMINGVQYTVDRDGNVKAVVLTPELWKKILDQLEDAEDLAMVDVWRERLERHPREWALKWEDVDARARADAVHCQASASPI